MFGFKHHVLIMVILTLLLALIAGCGQVVGNDLIIKTADPALSLGFHLAPGPGPVIVPEPVVVPDEEVGVLEPVPIPEPPCELIKGNISKDGRRLYHGRDSPQYEQVKINEDKGEKFFCSVEAAEAEGFTKAGG